MSKTKTTMKNLAKAVIAVMNDVKSIEKGMTVGSGNYSYKGVADKDVKQAYNKSMSENGLCILPIEIEETTDINRFVDSYGKPKMSSFTKVTTKYLLLHESGESQQIVGYGHGIDSGDKGAGKATTYALKYALLYTFLTPTGIIDDADSKHSEEQEAPQPTKEDILDLISKAISKEDLAKIKPWVVHFDLKDIAVTKSQTF